MNIQNLISHNNRHGAFAPQTVVRPREQVEEQIKLAIFSGALAIGAKLPSEVTLAEQFSVSRTTIREALRSLATNRLIYKVPGAGGGSFVKSVDHHSLGVVLLEGIENLIQLGSIEQYEAWAMREILEVPAARLAAVNRSSAEIAFLKEIIENEIKAEVNHPQVPEWDVQFHSTIAQASGNRVLFCLTFALHRSTEPVNKLVLSPEVGRITVQQHREVLAAIVAQDPDRAEVAIRNHLTYLRSHQRNQAAS